MPRNYSVLMQGLDGLYSAITPAQWPARLAWRLRPWDIDVEEQVSIRWNSPSSVRLCRIRGEADGS